MVFGQTSERERRGSFVQPHRDGKKEPSCKRRTSRFKNGFHAAIMFVVPYKEAYSRRQNGLGGWKQYLVCSCFPSAWKVYRSPKEFFYFFLRTKHQDFLWRGQCEGHWQTLTRPRFLSYWNSSSQRAAPGTGCKERIPQYFVGVFFFYFYLFPSRNLAAGRMPDAYGRERRCRGTRAGRELRPTGARGRVDAGEAAAGRNPQHTFKNSWRAEPRRAGESRDLTDCFFFQFR